jgi:hypothetical protein
MLRDAPGTVAVPMSEVGRFAMFTVALAGTKQPAGCHLSVMASASVTENLNSSIRTMPDDSEWMWILGDDHIWAHDCLLNMLQLMDDNPEADILVPLVVKRNPPWHLVVFHEDDSLRDPRIPPTEDMQGFRIFATADIVMGHLGIFNVRPYRHEGRWGAKVEFTTPDERYREIFMPDIEERHQVVVNGR